MGKYWIPIGAGLATFTSLVEIQAKAQEILMAQSKYLRNSSLLSLRRHTPGHTGFLRSSAKTWGFTSFSPTGFRFTLGWQASDFTGKRAFYAPFVNWGTGIYKGRANIVPLNAKRLAWRTKEGKWVSAKSVKGQPPQRMLERAADDFVRQARSLIPGCYARAVKKIFK